MTRILMRNRIIMLGAVLAVFLSGPAKSQNSITFEQLAAMYAAGGEIPLVDVRTSQEFNLIHFQGALNIPVDAISGRLDDFKGKPWILYCRTGHRAGQAADLLSQNGIDDVRLVQGGIADLPLFLKKHNDTDPQAVLALQKNIVVTVPAVGFRLPAFSISTQRGMAETPVADSAGRALVILFWKPGDAVSEDSLTQAVAFASSNQDVALVPIPLGNSDPIAVTKSLDASQYKGTVYLDPLGETAQSLKANAAPLFLLVDKDGVLRTATATGFSQAMPTQGGLSVKDMAADALAGKPMRFPDTGLFAEEADPLELKDKTAPAFALRDAQGRIFSLADNLGKKASVVIFFSLDCPYSRHELQALGAYDAKYAGAKQYQILAVTKDGGSEYRQQMDQFMSSNGITFPVIFDPTGDTMFQYRVTSIPEWVVVDKEGIIRLVNVGFAQNTDELLNGLLN